MSQLAPERMRRSWNTSVKHLVRLRCEAAIPGVLLATVPKSCLSRWRAETEGKYAGAELNAIAGEKLELLQRFAQDQRAQQVFMAYGRLVYVLTAVLRNAKQYARVLCDANEQVVEAIERCRGSIGIEKAIKVFRISRSTYQTWVGQVKAKCDRSTLLLCKRRYPFQLLGPEVHRMKRLLTSPELAHWPVRSIALYASRQGLVHASLNTWYRYRDLLGLRRALPCNRKAHRTGIRACRPDQIWHADVTLYRTLDGVKHYIYLVVDNFSHRVLAHRVSTLLSATLRVQTLLEAWKDAISLRGATLRTDLIVDGGPENVNRCVDAFIADGAVNIQRKIALKEVLFSNSMVEAANKILKYRYLLPRAAANTNALVKAVRWFVHDMNTVRPHGALEGLTPDEAYFGSASPIIHRSEQLTQARAMRLQMNTATKCGKCL